jgi:hypothetical protein
LQPRPGQGQADWRMVWNWGTVKPVK